MLLWSLRTPPPSVSVPSSREDWGEGKPEGLGPAQSYRLFSIHSLAQTALTGLELLLSWGSGRSLPGSQCQLLWGGKGCGEELVPSTDRAAG